MLIIERDEKADYIYKHRRSHQNMGKEKWEWERNELLRVGPIVLFDCKKDVSEREDREIHTQKKGPSSMSKCTPHN